MLEQEKAAFFLQYTFAIDKDVLEMIWNAKQSKATSLDLSYSSITNLIPIQELQELQELNINHTSVSDLSPLISLQNLVVINANNTHIRDLSHLKGLNNLKELNLFNTYINDLSPLSGLSTIHKLNIHSNEINNLYPLKDLKNLQELIISNTGVYDLSPLLNNIQLQCLYIHNTQVSDLSPLKELTNLRELVVSLTLVTDLSPLKKLIENGIEVKWERGDGDDGIFIADTPLSNPPIEIAKQGNAAILRYWEEQERSGIIQLNEARLLIVGQAGAGKTSLRTKLMNLKADLPTEDKTTRGIDIEILNFPNTEGGHFNLRIWDFGGQNIQHYAHQFFLSDSVVYALVRDERKEDGGMSYWLNIIQLLGKNSPILIVQNEKHGHNEDIKDLAAIRKAFPKVQEPIKLNLKLATDTAYKPFQHLRKTIEHLATTLPHVGQVYASSYKHLQEALQMVSVQKRYIHLSEYESLCDKQGISNRDTMYDFLRSYHQLGISLWFEHDIDLENYIFLRPKWIIDALFDLLYDGTERRKVALIDTQTVKTIWRGDDYRGMHGILLKLMLNFEMCYKIAGVERYLIPQNQPPCPIEITEHATATRVLFRYAFLPKGFLTRLICRQHTRIADQNVWNNAVIFGDKAAATVWTYETYETNTIELIADGQVKALLLNETINQLDAIHTTSKFANLEVEKLVPCPCRTCQKRNKPYYFNYDYLQRKLLKGQYKAECQTSLDDVPIRDILKEIRVFSFQQIRDLIAADRIETALNLLRGRYDERSDIIQLMSRFYRLEEQSIKSVKFKEVEGIERNQLVDAVLKLLTRLEKEE